MARTTCYASAVKHHTVLKSSSRCQQIQTATQHLCREHNYVGILCILIANVTNYSDFQHFCLMHVVRLIMVSHMHINIFAHRMARAYEIQSDFKWRAATFSFLTWIRNHFCSYHFSLQLNSRWSRSRDERERGRERKKQREWKEEREHRLVHDKHFTSINRTITTNKRQTLFVGFEWILKQ